MFTYNLYFVLVLISTIKVLQTPVTVRNEYNVDFITAVSCSRPKHDHAYKPRTMPASPNKTLFSIIILLSGDIQSNPGPRTTSVYPCGLCESPVTWNCRGVACDACSIWYHGSCIEMCSKDYALLNRSCVQWLCHKCDSVNCDSFTFRSFSLNCSNYFTPIADPDLTMFSLVIGYWSGK